MAQKVPLLLVPGKVALPYTLFEIRVPRLLEDTVLHTRIQGEGRIVVSNYRADETQRFATVGKLLHSEKRRDGRWYAHLHGLGTVEILRAYTDGTVFFAETAELHHGSLVPSRRTLSRLDGYIDSVIGHLPHLREEVTKHRHISDPRGIMLYRLADIFVEDTAKREELLAERDGEAIAAIIISEISAILLDGSFQGQDIQAVSEVRN